MADELNPCPHPDESDAVVLWAETAAQDKQNRVVPPGAAEKFLRDAKDAEALLNKWDNAQFTDPT